MALMSLTKIKWISALPFLDLIRSHIYQVQFYSYFQSPRISIDIATVVFIVHSRALIFLLRVFIVLNCFNHCDFQSYI